MDWYVLVAGCLTAGGFIGFLGGVLGIGGGLLAIPLLALILGMPQQLAQGTALLMVVPAVLMTLRQYNRRASLDLHAATIGGLSSAVFTWMGAQVALGLDPVLLRYIYASFVFVIAVFYFHQSMSKRRTRQAGARQLSGARKLWFIAIGAAAGMAGGIFGVGGAVLIVPLLTTVLRYTQTGAQGLGLSIVAPSTAVALATYAWHGQVDWVVGLPLALGSILMVPYGVRLAYSLPEPRLKLIFACMLLVIMVMLLFKV